MGGVPEESRGRAVVRLADLVMPFVEEQPEDPERIDRRLKDPPRLGERVASPRRRRQRQERHAVESVVAGEVAGQGVDAGHRRRPRLVEGTLGIGAKRPAEAA